MKQKLNENMFSTIFVRLANLYYLNGQYEKCISTCKTGLEIYPDYLTAKILLLKAFLRLGYLNEAENLFNELEMKISNLDIYESFKKRLLNLKQEAKQERIFYPSEVEIKVKYEDFHESIKELNKINLKLDISEILDDKNNANKGNILKDKIYGKFKKQFGKMNFKTAGEETGRAKDRETMDIISNSPNETEKSETDYFGKIKIVTETLADIYAQQGNFREAFNAYNLLIRAGSQNKKRIESKLLDLERMIVQEDDN